MCEVKRLFVRPGVQHKGIGTTLMLMILDAAEKKGYKCVVLDTLERLTAANKLYANLGFTNCDPYYHNPLPGVIYWCKSLRTL